NKPSQEGLYRHFAAVAESTDLPLMLYNVPGRTVANMLPATVARLAKIENIVALKEAAGSTDQVTELKRMLPADFMVYSGDDSMTLPLLALGCEGIVSVVSHVVGNEMQAMIQAFLAGDFRRAAAIHCQLFPIFKGMFMTTSPTPIKEACNQLGLNAGPVRLPLVEATDMEKAEIRRLLREAGKFPVIEEGRAAGVDQESKRTEV
ncbi:MAG TPA: 4-hydroxy-tetrahydrodipicolinate synthase, partial [Verrucomicrobiae bacterium]|nr:4-hydroxy-tetrahydrodipicolinate synthase [Verrucomicrobiae bacterium]